MNRLRLVLLVLLAVMLPVRGVMAAAMLCPPAPAAAVQSHHAGHAHDGAALHHAHEDATAGHAQHEGAAGSDTCNLCSACCSVPPMPSAAPAMPSPHEQAAAGFPAYAEPAHAFQSDGPERPPRST